MCLPYRDSEETEALRKLIAAQVQRIRELETERDRLLSIVRDVEWCDWVPNGTPYPSRLCPLCDQVESKGHAPDCPIGAALATSESSKQFPEVKS